MLMDDGAHPCQVGTFGQFVEIEIPGDQLDSIRIGVFPIRIRACATAWGRSNKVALVPGKAFINARVQVPEAPPTSNRWENLSLPRLFMTLSAIGPELACMAPMKAAWSA